MTTEGSKKYPVLWIGLETAIQSAVEQHFVDADFTRVMTAEQFELSYEQWGDGVFAAIFCGPALEGITNDELAQVLKNQCPMTPKYFATADSANFEVKKLIKNGFNDVFLLPLDHLLLKRTIKELESGAKQRAFRPIRIFDLEAGAKLEFDTYVFLPLNKKYIKYTAANAAFDPKKMEKLNEHEVGSIFIDKGEMEKFYKYAGRRLMDLGKSEGEAISSTERQEKLLSAVRNIFTDLFDPNLKGDFEEGKEMVDHCSNIISNYITKGASSDWYQRLMSTIGEDADSYSHAKNVSTFAALFAIGIGHPRPEDLAMAGLFHDLGLASQDGELGEKPMEQMTADEKKIYMEHPERSVNLVKQKRIIISPEVEKAILQHHEMYSGKGFPKNLLSHRISDDAQILSFADQFDYLTRIIEGRPRISPLGAWEIIKKNGSIGGEILNKIRAMLESHGHKGGGSSAA